MENYGELWRITENYGELCALVKHSRRIDSFKEEFSKDSPKDGGRNFGTLAFHVGRFRFDHRSACFIRSTENFDASEMLKWWASNIPS